ncbi:hypothetical protein LRQ08_31515 (plasmid) [Rhodococcus qingshengii]|uniref:hypothetical protein n=1 Tax=Rhodococcus qingshengii TaxID=334542 RepID=UPI00211272F0|nr:hypothetical protein [Rhodococcus qingshengii]UUE28466.1 hypothetical protein LRQ08_31515 [Rhodococcus qingshengii]
MALNVKTVESAVRVTLGAGIPGTTKMLLVCGICVGTAIVFTTVTSSQHLKKLLWLHISLSVVTAALSFYFFFKTPWPASNPDNRTFDNQYAFLPGYAEGLMLGMAYPFLLCLMVTIIAIRQADRRTATGWGLIIISPGAAALSAYAALRIGYLGSVRWGSIRPRHPLLSRAYWPLSAFSLSQRESWLQRLEPRLSHERNFGPLTTFTPSYLPVGLVPYGHPSPEAAPQIGPPIAQRNCWTR